MGDLGPGGKPRTRAEARRLSRDIRARSALALEPYLVRSGEWQLKARDPGGALEKIAEEYGIEVEELEPRVDHDKSLKMGALIELICDLMHTSAMMGMRWNELLSYAHEMYRGQQAELYRRLVYEQADDQILEDDVHGIVEFE